MTHAMHCPPVRNSRARPRAFWSALFWLGALLCGCADLSSSDQPPIEVASRVDLDRVYGGWYIVATIPNWFEKKLVAPYDFYSPSPDGILEDFYVRSGGFDSELKHFVVHDYVDPGTNNARWKVEFFGLVRLPFLLLYVDPDYRYLLFGEENRKVGWIYARTPLIDEAAYQSLLLQFKRRGYDITAFRRWVQTPEQIGQPGFWSDGLTPLAR